MPTTAVVNYSGDCLIPWENPGAAREDAVNLAPSLTYSKGQLLGEKVGVKEVQRITITGTPTGGSFTVTKGAATSAAIPWNASAAAVRNALEAMSTVGIGGVTVTGGPGPGTPWDITFTTPGDVAAMTTTDSLTGGSAPASAVTTTTAGSSGTPGQYAKYDADATDGSQNPVGFLKYPCIVDSAGNIALGDTAGGENNVTSKTIDMYRCGTFRTEDLVGVDEAAIAALGARLIRGTLASGVLMVPGV
jgi:hypothetical protein